MTQPDPIPPTRAVLLLHGFFSVPMIMAWLARDLRQAGWHTASPFLPSWRWSLQRIAEHVAAHIARTPSLRDAATLDIVAHSMGGLVARAVIAHSRPANLGKVVCLGTPHGGSEIADRFDAVSPIARKLVLGAARPALITRRDHGWDRCLGVVDYPLANIAGTSSRWEGPTARLLPEPNDGKVSVASTHCAGEAAHLCLPVPHRLLPIDAEARRRTFAFLRDGRLSD